ncbi:MAG: type II toxin-antitoxin system HipA family toxin [Bacteroidia bacterium]|nr:type II toxin-antitoxin system HipA family toxin [Bacteroidia bacterium]
MVADIFIWGQKVGAVAWNELRGFARIEFNPGFEGSGLNLAPLQMPLSAIQQGKRLYSFPHLPKATFRGLPGLLADSLPDDFGNQVIDAWLASQGRSKASFNPVNRLCYIADRGMGALEFRPAQSPAFSHSTPVEINQLVDLAAEILEEKRQFRTQLGDDDTQALQDILKVSSSAGGARAKAILAIHPQSGEVRSGQIDAPPGFEHWLLKFDGVEGSMPNQYGRIEFAYHLMARACGIEMADCELLEEGGRAHFMTRRFDRPGQGRKLHLQTLCAIGHLDYYLPSSYEQAFQVARGMLLPALDAEELFRRMAFNVMARNLDDHTKNISFFMDEKGVWRLAPAYDLVFAYGPEFTRHKMSVNGKYKDIQKEDLLAVGKEMNIKGRKRILEEVADGIRDWESVAVEAGLSQELTQNIGKSHQAFW